MGHSALQSVVHVFVCVCGGGGMRVCVCMCCVCCVGEGVEGGGVHVCIRACVVCVWGGGPLYVCCVCVTSHLVLQGLPDQRFLGGLIRAPSPA